MNPETIQTESEEFHPRYDEYKKFRPAWTTSIRRGIEFVLFRFGLYLGKKLSFSKLQKFGRGLGIFSYHVLRKDRGIAEKQLELIFSDLNEIQRRRWIKECFIHFGQMLFEFLGLQHFLREGHNLLHIENEDKIKKAVKAKKGVILLAIHSGNWELICPYAKSSRIKMKAATSNFPDPRINKLMENQRENEYMEILPRGTSKAIRKLIKCLRDKEVLILAIDQDTNVLSTWIPFFGIPAKTPVGAAILALKTGANVLSYTACRQDDGTFIMRFEGLGNFTRKNNNLDQDVYSTLREINQHLEKRIRENPTQWAWFHRRWRHRPSKEELMKMKEFEENEAKYSKK